MAKATQDSETAAPRRPTTHDATYARDKKNPGKWIIRVICTEACKIEGAHIGAYAGRTVPVRMFDAGKPPHDETLARCIWTGVDEGTGERAGTGRPVGLYQFVPTPKEEAPEFPF